MTEELNHLSFQHDQGRKYHFVRDGYHRKMFDRMKRRFDQQVDIDSDQKRDERPDHSQHGFGQDRQPAFIAVESEPLINGVQESLDKVEHQSKHINHEVEHSDDDAGPQLVPGIANPLGSQFLSISSQSRVQRHAGQNGDYSEHQLLNAEPRISHGRNTVTDADIRAGVAM